MSETPQEDRPMPPSIFNKLATPKPSELTKALVEVQKTLPKLEKNATNPHFKSRYSDLSEVTSKILPKLAENGLAWVTRPTLEADGTMALAYQLRHVSGEVIDGVYPLPPASQNFQQLGSAITYARRYALCAVVGVAADEDDDGRSAQQATAAQPPAQAQRGRAQGQRRAPDADAQRRKYHKMREQLGWDEEAGHDFIRELSQGRATRWTDLDERQRGVVLDAMGERIREAGHDFIDELSQGRATRWTDLDERQRGVVLDAMGERIRELSREPEGPLVPEGVNPETGEVADPRAGQTDG